jgi:hypothetical protein
MTRRRKQVVMTLTVSVPTWLTAAEARREVRNRIDHQAAFLSGKYDGETWRDLYPPNDVKVRSIRPPSRC